MKTFSILFVLIVVAVLGGCQGGSLKNGFYRRSCPKAERIVRDATWGHVSRNPILPAKFLRMHFHDCFVRGCDGSVLINSNANNNEKDAFPNLSLSGFEIIDNIKAEVEKECPGVVSCADVLALAARDAVSFPSKFPLWDVPTGRRDGRVSDISEVLPNLPSPFFNFQQLLQNFRNKGLNEHDLVVLSGGHTLGIGHCNLFSFRLYNFTGNNDQDPALDPKYADFLRTQCKSLQDTTTVVAMDQTPFRFDTNYYQILKQNKGLFLSDAALLTDEFARHTVSQLTNPAHFHRDFAHSMKKMGKIGVLTGDQGEIRTICSVVN